MKKNLIVALAVVLGGVGVCSAWAEGKETLIPGFVEAKDAVVIGKDKAKAEAFEHAGVQENDVRELEIEVDFKQGTRVYEVDFTSAEFEYNYNVDAKSGEILHDHREYDDDYVAPVAERPAESKSSSASNTTDIGKDKAKAVALEHAGLSESKVSRLSVERDVDDGRVEYSVEFMANGKEYDYEISAKDGKILDVDVEREEAN